MKRERERETVSPNVGKRPSWTSSGSTSRRVFSDSQRSQSLRRVASLFGSSQSVTRSRSSHPSLLLPFAHTFRDPSPCVTLSIPKRPIATLSASHYGHSTRFSRFGGFTRGCLPSLLCALNLAIYHPPDGRRATLLPSSPSLLRESSHRTHFRCLSPAGRENRLGKRSDRARVSSRVIERLGSS